MTALHRAATLLLVAVVLAPARGAEPTYWQDVRPLLRKHCTACHSAKNLRERDVSGGLALDSYEAAVAPGKGAAVRPGKSSASPLVQLLVAADEQKRMPLAAPPLTRESVELLRRWIDAGAKEGPRTEVVEAAAAPTRTRRLDVVLPTAAVPPRGVLGPAAPAKLDLALSVGPLAPVAALAYSPDGKLLASGSYGLVAVWDLSEGRPVRFLTNVLGAVNDLRFSPDGRLLAVAGGQPSAKGDLRLFQTSDWTLVATLRGHDDVVSSTAFSPDGFLLATASFDKTVRIWNIAERRVLHTLTGHSDFVYAVAFAPDGSWVASASKDRSVKLVDTKTGKSRFTLSGMNEDVLTVAVSPDGKSVVSSGLEPGLSWWNPATGQRVRTGGGHGVATHEIAFGKDGKQAVSGGADGQLRLWDGTAGTLVRSHVVGSSVYAAALRSDGKQLASGSFDGLVRLWDGATGRLLATLLALRPTGDDIPWLGVTPEGYVAGSPELVQRGTWRMGTTPVAGEAAWKVLGQPTAVAKALRGEALTPPAFAK